MKLPVHRPWRLLLLLSLAVLPGLRASAQQRLKVSDNKRYLVKADGTPFFYLGDTGWELLHQLGRNDAYTYLSNRAAKGFTVIQTVVLGEMDGLAVPNANGDLPFTNLDPTKPNEKYFAHVDQVVNLGTSMGLYMALLPTWGAWVMKETHPIFPPHQAFTPDNARTYGRFLGSRYKNNPNLIWVLGGDRNATGYEKTWEALAAGLREGDGGTHLITYHPRGQMSSSAFWQNAPWLDFNMIQSGHGSRQVNSYDFIAHDYNLQPVKPTFDGETNYEDHPVSFHPSNGWFSDYDVRVSSYYSVFAGGFGITYGCHNIWQMNTGKRPIAYARHTWQESLDLPGAYQMRYLRNLVESRPFLTRVPDQSLLLPTQTQLVPFEGMGSQHMQATRDGTPGKNDATYVMVYLPVGRSLNVNTAVIPGKRLRAWWYDPRHGAAIPLGESDNKGQMEAEWNTLPWHNGAGPDWVMVIDDASKGYPPPGSKSLF
ncbi:MAG: glycoside hydrolase family 140 protein [Cytophagales bacterium]|nr:glycoside hydrolase family 140 protein [Cytophagales bacterium]